MRLMLVLLLMAALCVSCGGDKPKVGEELKMEPAADQPPKEEPASKLGEFRTLPAGMQLMDTKIGSGLTAERGNTLDMHYTGWVYQNGEKGKQFDSSYDRGETFKFRLGAGRVIRGWDLGIEGMKEGGKRTLIIPPQLGYGEQGVPGVIPPNATLLFEVELMKVRP